MYVGNTLQVAHGTSLTQHYALPSLTNPTPTPSNPFDTIGDAIANGKPAIAATAGAGLLTLGTLAAVRAKSGILGTLGHGALGAAAGALVGSVVGIGAVALTRKLDGSRTTHTATDGTPLPTGTAATSPSPEHVRMMTFNLRGGESPNGWNPSQAQLDKLAATVKSQHPDILVVQELDNAAPRSKFYDELDDLAKRLNATSAVGAAPMRMIDGRGQEVGVLTFGNFTVDNARDLVFPTPGGDSLTAHASGVLSQVEHSVLGPILHLPTSARAFQPRNAIDTVVTTPNGTPIRVLTSHLTGTMDGTANTSAMQKQQVGEIAKSIGQWSGPTLYAGDFNIHSDSAAGANERSLLGAAGMTDDFSAAGIAPDSPKRESTVGDHVRIDHMYSSSQFTVNDIGVDTKDPASSDHFPVVEDLTLQ